MCIIAAIGHGVELPAKDILQNCFDNNPDGSGFAYADGSNVSILKGYFDFERFYNDVSSIHRIFNKPAMVLHFRIATSGKINRSCTHPFPLTADVKEMKKDAISTKIAVAHNGIISQYPGTKKLSDTMVFIRDVVSKIYPFSPGIEKIFDMATQGSKFAFLNHSGGIQLTGKGWIKEGKVYFSNSTYRPTLKHDYGYNWDMTGNGNGKGFSSWNRKFTGADDLREDYEWSQRKQEIDDDMCEVCGREMTLIDNEFYCLECDLPGNKTGNKAENVGNRKEIVWKQ